MAWTAPPLAARLAAMRLGPLVGRSQELGIFEGVWERVASGHRQIVFIGGEPGAGKTRLAAEVAGVLHSHGVAGLHGVSTQDAGVPYQAFAEILDQVFLTAEPGTLEQHVALSSADLGRLSGHVARHVSGDEAPPVATEVRRELFDAVVGLFRAMSAEMPMLVVLDDLHWAQRPTLALLEHVAREAVDLPLLVIGTFRTTAPDRSDELAERIAEMHREEGVRRLDLSGLDTDAIAEYIGRQSGVAPATVRAPAALLRDRTGGNPFFLRELWTDLEAHGGVHALSSPLRVPASIGDTVEVRLAGLGAPAREVLDIAAVVGDVFDVSTISACRQYGSEGDPRRARLGDGGGTGGTGLVRRGFLRLHPLADTGSRTGEARTLAACRAPLAGRHCPRT